jgi:hypothetical protein
MEEKAGRAGYRLARWGGYSCRVNDNMSHFAWVLDRAET